MEEVRSHPTMGAWIEIAKGVRGVWKKLGRTPRWVRGLKSACKEDHQEHQ